MAEAPAEEVLKGGVVEVAEEEEEDEGEGEDEAVDEGAEGF